MIVHGGFIGIVEAKEKKLLLNTDIRGMRTREQRKTCNRYLLLCHFSTCLLLKRCVSVNLQEFMRQTDVMSHVDLVGMLMKSEY